LLLILLPNQTASQQPKKVVKETMTMSDWYRFVKTCSAKYGVDPYFALAVAETESSCKGRKFRFGKMGKGTYYGPFGIKNIFLKKWNIADPYVNTEIGIRALARYRDQKKSLKKYNASYNVTYYKRIKYLENKNRKDRFFDRPILSNMRR
jgi:hypothetical protein